jgi:hypothetical protein
MNKVFYKFLFLLFFRVLKLRIIRFSRQLLYYFRSSRRLLQTSRRIQSEIRWPSSCRVPAAEGPGAAATRQLQKIIAVELFQPRYSGQFAGFVICICFIPWSHQQLITSASILFAAVCRPAGSNPIELVINVRSRCGRFASSRSSTSFPAGERYKRGTMATNFSVQKKGEALDYLSMAGLLLFGWGGHLLLLGRTESGVVMVILPFYR